MTIHSEELSSNHDGDLTNVIGVSHKHFNAKWFHIFISLPLHSQFMVLSNFKCQELLFFIQAFIVAHLLVFDSHGQLLMC
jgi:hypothetical protein